MPYRKRPARVGLYDPAYEKENCGVGFVAHLKGERSFQIIRNAEEILLNMSHRGAVGSEKNTGDGAGILTATPWEFLERVAVGIRDCASGARSLRRRNRLSSSRGRAAREVQARVRTDRRLRRATASPGMAPRAGRRLRHRPNREGVGARHGAGLHRGDCGAVGGRLSTDSSFVIRKAGDPRIRGKAHDPDDFFYICSLSTKVIVYKGMLTAWQLVPYFKDLSDPDYKSHLAMIHSRFSTNTFPSWDRAQPLRFMSHNGEINTLRGNVNKMKARENTLSSSVIRRGPAKASIPIIEPDLSDSGCFDNTLELLYMAGRSLPGVGHDDDSRRRGRTTSP